MGGSHVANAHRKLIYAMASFELTHALSLLAMIVLLLPGLSPHFSLDARVHYVTEHVTSWRIGWISWQLSALSDAWLSFALLAWTRATGARAAGRWALAALPLLVLALVPDQYAEVRLITDFTHATASAAWLEQLREHMRLSGIWACLAYTSMTACWIRASHHFDASSAQPSSSRARWAEGSVLLVFLGAAIANHFAWHATGENRYAFDWAVACNAYAFAGLLLSVGAIALRARAAQKQESRRPLQSQHG